MSCTGCIGGLSTWGWSRRRMRVGRGKGILHWLTSPRSCKLVPGRQSGTTPKQSGVAWAVRCSTSAHIYLKGFATEIWFWSYLQIQKFWVLLKKTLNFEFVLGFLKKYFHISKSLVSIYTSIKLDDQIFEFIYCWRLVRQVRVYPMTKGVGNARVKKSIHECSQHLW